MTLRERIEAVLAESPLAISTPELIAIIGGRMKNARARIWDVMRELLDRGVVEKTIRLVHNEDVGHAYQIAFWVATGKEWTPRKRYYRFTRRVDKKMLRMRDKLGLTWAAIEAKLDHPGARQRYYKLKCAS